MHKKFSLVTIITPTYNREKLLEETMESILSQHYAHLEYIVIDDGSTDNTEEVVNKLQKKYKKVKIVYIKQKNQGETKAVNKGFSVSQGEILAVINSDDPLLPGSIAKIVKYMQEFPVALAVYPDWKMIDENSKKIKIVQPVEYDYLRMLEDHYCIPGPGTFFRKKAIKFTGGRSSKFQYLSDFAFWLKLGMYGPIYHLPQTLATFRVHSGSQGLYARGNKMAQESREIIDWVYKDPNLPKEALTVKNTAYASAFYHAGRKSTNILKATYYYGLSFKYNPIVFFRKTIYDLKYN